MKWIIVLLAAASLLVLLSIGLNGSRDKVVLSADSHAAKLCEEGTRDVHAFRLRTGLRKLDECLELDPGLAEASIARAVAFARLGERGNYSKELVRADSLAARIVDDRRRLIAQLRLSDLGASRFAAMNDSFLTRLKSEAPDNIYVLVAEATQAAKTGDADQIEQAWQRIIVSDPNYANSYNMLGYLELDRGNYELAIEYMQKYAFLAPDLANPHDSLGDVLMVLGRYEEAESEYRTSVTMQPDFYASLVNLGRVYLVRGQMKTGLKILNQVRNEVRGSDIERRIDQSIISNLVVSGYETELADAVSAYVARYPHDDTGAYYRAVSLARRGLFEEGQAVMDSCLAAWRGNKGYDVEDANTNMDAIAFQYDGIVADSQETYAEAAQSWAAAVSTRVPDTSERFLRYLRYRLAAALRKAGQPREALQELDMMLQVNPRIMIALVEKVECHLDLGEGELAHQSFQQLEWSLAKSDSDYPLRAVAAELETRVSALADVR